MWSACARVHMHACMHACVNVATAVEMEQDQRKNKWVQGKTEKRANASDCTNNRYRSILIPEAHHTMPCIHLYVPFLAHRGLMNLQSRYWLSILLSQKFIHKPRLSTCYFISLMTLEVYNYESTPKRGIPLKLIETVPPRAHKNGWLEKEHATP